MAPKELLSSSMLDRPSQVPARQESAGRNKRKQRTRPIVRDHGKENEVAEEQSINRTEDQDSGKEVTEREGGDRGSKEWGGTKDGGIQPGAYHSFRRTTKHIKGTDRTPGRRAKELGITYPSLACSEDNHYWVEVIDSVFRCKHCWNAKWQPRSFSEGIVFGDEIRIIGLEEAYAIRVGNDTKVMKALCMLEGLRLARDNGENVEEVFDGIVREIGYKSFYSNYGETY